MRRSLTSSLLVLAVAACSGPADRSSQRGNLDSVDVSESPAPATSEAAGRGGGPDVAVTAAPGVAFNYRYAFRLLPERIEQVQEQHAAACEQLGVARCRITGMRYRLVSADDIDAALEFALEPSIARRFGREGLAAVQRAEGILVESAISGADVGTGIRRDQQLVTQLRADLARIEQQIAAAPEDRKNVLREEAERIRERIRAVEQNTGEQQESLATTPMTFVYGSGAFEPGFGERPGFARTAAQGWERFLDGLAILFLILMTLLPWAVLAGFAWLAGRSVWRRQGRDAIAAPAPAGPTDA